MFCRGAAAYHGVSNHMKQLLRLLASIALGFALLGIIAWGAVRLVVFLWHQLATLNDNLAVGVVTAVTTIFVATLTVVLGRYFERQKEVESHYREKKTAIYDSFLVEYYKLFDGPEKSESVDLVRFLRSWRRQLVLWGGADVLMAFIKWKEHLAKGKPDAQALFLTEELFKAIRSDLGLSNRGISKGAFIKLQLKSADLLLALAKKNPNITLAELGDIEKKLGLAG